MAKNKRKPTPWILALIEWNDARNEAKTAMTGEEVHKYKIPCKGTPEYQEVREIQARIMGSSCSLKKREVEMPEEAEIYVPVRKRK